MTFIMKQKLSIYASFSSGQQCPHPGLRGCITQVQIPRVEHLKFYYCTETGHLLTCRKAQEHLLPRCSCGGERKHDVVVSYLFHLLLITYGSNEINDSIDMPQTFQFGKS